MTKIYRFLVDGYTGYLRTKKEMLAHEKRQTNLGVTPIESWEAVNPVDECIRLAELLRDARDFIKNASRLYEQELSKAPYLEARDFLDLLEGLFTRNSKP